MQRAGDSSPRSRAAQCWHRTKRRFRPDSSTRTPKSLSLPSRISWTVLRDMSALTRAPVTVILEMIVFPVSVATEERKAPGSGSLQLTRGE